MYQICRKCALRLGKYPETAKNGEIRILHNIPAIESILTQQGLILYINWKSALEFTYMGNSIYIDQHLETLKKQ